jgi:hypothetical protein
MGRMKIERIDHIVMTVDSGFALFVEQKGIEDPQRTLIGGLENGVLKLHEINGKDTLKNTKDPNVLLHGNKRIVEYDANYFIKVAHNFLTFSIEGLSKNTPYSGPFSVSIPRRNK